MTVTVTLTVTPTAPKSGDSVTATYAVTGNDPIPPVSAQVSGVATVGGQPIDVTTTLTIPGVPAQPVTYAMPTCDGLTFAVTKDPAVFTAVVP